MTGLRCHNCHSQGWLLIFVKYSLLSYFFMYAPNFLPSFSRMVTRTRPALIRFVYLMAQTTRFGPRKGLLGSRLGGPESPNSLFLASNAHFLATPLLSISLKLNFSKNHLYKMGIKDRLVTSIPILNLRQLETVNDVSIVQPFLASFVVSPI